ncbi:MAG: tetratricopeptide repeat protein, partial [Bacteroidia bacterium]|nr:tetratricopeptide repeat protein [Bacteroidia bacterium]
MKLYKPDSELPPTQNHELDNWIQYLVDDKFIKDQSIKGSFINRITSKFKKLKSGLLSPDIIYIVAILGVFLLSALIILMIINSKIVMLVVVLLAFYTTYIIYAIKKNDPYVVEYFDQSSEGIDSDYRKHKLRMMMQHAEELIELGKFELAANKLDKLVFEFPDIWNVTYNLAFCYIKLGRYDDSLDLYHTLLRKIKYDPSSTQKERYRSMVYNQIGNIFELKHDLTKAHRYFLKGYDNEKEYFVTQLNLLSICLKLGKFDEAKFWFRVLKSKGNLHHINLISNESFRKLQDMPWC